MATAERTELVKAANPANVPAMGTSSRRTLVWGLIGAVLMWAAFPPLDLWPLAWIAPLGWLMLIRRNELAGSKPYFVLYGVGVVFWGTTFYWIALPHWSAIFGWIALTVYFACYTPLFIGLSRVAVHRYGISIVLAAPIVWTGLELVRAHFLSGFLMAALGHTQYRWINLIQISDLVGAYGVSFLVMFVAACLARIVPFEGRPLAVWPVGLAGIAVSSALLYGWWSRRVPEPPEHQFARIALLQGTIDTKFGLTPDERQEMRRRVYIQYLTLARQAVADGRELDLIVYPESMYPSAIIEADRPENLPPHITPEDVAAYLQMFERDAAALNTPLLLAVERLHFGDQFRNYSCSVLIDPASSNPGTIAGSYAKMHPVVFGEYVPLGDYFPWLYQLTPLSGGLTAGTRPESFEVGRRQTYRVAPSICFESVVPHLMRRQVNELIERNEAPDVLVTQTNDGWFYGSAGLDMHLACGVFRAIECRRPFVTAANTGISAAIDSFGRVLERAAKREEAVVLAHVPFDGRKTIYLRAGDWFAHGCAIICLLMAATGWRRRRPDVVG